MITNHHLGVSQSDRIVWLMEELNLPYTLKWYDRKDQLAPPEYLALHPASTAPVIDDDGRVIAESAVIVEYICHRYAGGALTVGPTKPNYVDDLPNVKAYVKRIGARPAYQKAMQIAGPAATAPTR